MTIQPPSPPRNRYGRGSDASASSSTTPPSSFTPTTSPSSQRRRSSAAHTRPAGPPPNLPIPSLPTLPGSSTPEPSAQTDDSEREEEATDYNSYSLQSASLNPPVLAIPQSTDVYTPQLSASSSVENLSDPPPRSILPSTSRVQANSNGDQHQRQNSDRRLLSPSEARPTHEARPSSRRTLTRALELAREAVALDGTDQDPYGAVMAYGRSVALLSEVMERVRRGEDSTETNRRPGRRRSVVAQEEEIRRLKSIHDTYADRMNILSLIYSIPPQPHSVASLYSAMSSTDSTRPSSPTNASTSPSTESSHTQHYSDTSSANTAPFSLDDYLDDPDQPDDTEPGTYNADVPISPTRGTSGSSLLNHPYSSRHDTMPAVPPPSSSSTFSPGRQSIVSRRGRASSTLPPPPPPPSGSPPPAPSSMSVDSSPNIPHVQPSRIIEPIQRLRVVSSAMTSHQRTGSGSRLASLEEEQDRAIDGLPGNAPVDRRSLLLDTPRTAKRDSHPLPPLPSPPPEGRHESPDATPRNPVPERPSARTSSLAATRARNGSSSVSQSQLINSSTSQGTISQRRLKSSTPPSSMRPPSPSGSSISVGSTGSVYSSRIQMPNTASMLPPTAMAPGRARAASQPGRRPSILGNQESYNEQRPPLPMTPHVNGLSRNYSSRLNPNTPALMVQTDGLPSIFVSQQAGVPGAMPLTPTSALPPLPPSDPLRKPYHMMSLLRATMTNSTGGYITRRLHVPQEVWSQGGAKLVNLVEKVRAVEILCASLEDLQSCSSEYFGAGNVSSGLALGIGSVGRKEGESWISKLEEFSAVCEGVVANFGKKLGVGEGFVLKKNSGVTSWGSKLTRRFDKLTNGKNLDSPAAYVQGLKLLFLHAQLLDEHTKAVLSSPIAPAYEALPLDIRVAAEQKLRRSSEFFASVILTFVIRDLSQLLDKYAKKCEKWLAE